MKTSFLNYYKQILNKVSFDRFLLRKEYQKAIKLLAPKEIDELNYWMQQQGLSNKLIYSNTNSQRLEKVQLE